MRQLHPFHLVDPSPWPFFSAFGAFCLVTGLTMFIHRFSGGFFFCVLVFFSFCMGWLFDGVTLSEKERFKDTIPGLCSRGFDGAYFYLLRRRLCFFLLFFGHFFTQA